MKNKYSMITFIIILLGLVTLRYIIPVIWKVLVFLVGMIWGSLYSIVKFIFIVGLIYLFFTLIGS